MIKKVGKKQMVIQFGNGDVNIIPGILAEEDIGIVGLRNQEPREIGINNGDKAPNNITEFPIILQFDKKESIDVLIHALKETKKMMENRKEIIDRVQD